MERKNRSCIFVIIALLACVLVVGAAPVIYPSLVAADGPTEAQEFPDPGKYRTSSCCGKNCNNQDMEYEETTTPDGYVDIPIEEHYDAPNVTDLPTKETDVGSGGDTGGDSGDGGCS